MSAAYSLRLQNRLGMVVAAALALKNAAPAIDEKIEKTLRGVHDSLAEAKLDREEVVGPRPKTTAALVFLRQRTPEWLSFWHVLGSAIWIPFGATSRDEACGRTGTARIPSKHRRAS